MLREGFEKVAIKMVILEADWPELRRISPPWRDQAVTTKNWIDLFKDQFADDLARAKWSVDVRSYKMVPQMWGICIDDTSLFLGHTYWSEVGSERRKILRGGTNPTEFIKSKDGEVSHCRIQEFIGWFNCFWDQTEMPEADLKNQKADGKLRS